MKFSVIVPVYNVEKYLESCIESVLSQSYADYEIVLVDDGSRDSSGRLCDDLAAKYPQRVKVLHQQNKGQLLTRCAGVNIATGDYCVFLDGDDLLDSECLTTLSATAEEYNSPDAIIFTLTGTDFVTSKKAELPFEDGKEFCGEELKELYKYFFFHSALNSMCTKAVKRPLLQNNQEFFNAYSQLRCAEDRLQSMMALTYCERVVCIDKSLYTYRLVQGSVTREFTADNINRLNTRPMCDAEEYFIKLWGIDDENTVELQQAGFLNNAMHILLNFYSGATRESDKKLLLNYDWQSFVKKDYFNNLKSNRYITQAYRKMWHCVLTGNKAKLRYCMFKINFNKKLKSNKK